MSSILNIPNAAKSAGMSIRHFRRTYTERGGKFFRIGRKFFILTKDLDEWKKARASR